MKAFVQSQAMGGGAMKRCGPRNRKVQLPDPDKIGVLQDGPGVGLALKIVKRLYGKENPVYTQKQGVE